MKALGIGVSGAGRSAFCLRDCLWVRGLGLAEKMIGAVAGRS
jgi:hypothetical protein